MVKCNCGKEITTVPDWLRDVKVNFVCHNCPNRDLPGITQVDLMGVKEEEVALVPMKSTMQSDASDNPSVEDDDEDDEES